MSRKWHRFSLTSKFIPLALSFVFGFILSFIVFNFFTEKQLFLSNEPEVFQFESYLDRYFLVCIIFTSVKNVAKRNCIRNTWVHLANENFRFKYYFVIGTDRLSSQIKNELINENNKHKDLLMLPNLSDSYHNLSLKVIHSFKWISTSHKFEYLLKVDDDSFVRVDILYKDLQQKHQENFHSNRPLYWGFFDGRAHVKQKGVWKEKNWFLCDRYLPYALGGGYVLSRQLIEYVSSNANMLQLYQSEDASLGTWLAPLSINRIHDIRFDTEYRSRGCNNNFLIQHKQSISDMKLKYNSLVNFGHLCPNKEFEDRLTYEYNWKVPPSKCCIRNLTMLTSNP